MNNTVRNEAQTYAIWAIVVAVAVLLVFFFLSKSGVGSQAATDATNATSSSQSAGTAPNPAAT